MSLIFGKLNSGGLITNYFCSSKCAHCLYNCSPSWQNEYIAGDVTNLILKKILAMKCDTIHIGGGEPFLNIESLYEVLKNAHEIGINIEYIETNSSWFKSMKETINVLNKVKSFGVNRLLVSISPFHNEYIKFDKVKGLMEACRMTDIDIVPWSSSFIADLSLMDDKDTHTLAEYNKKFGKDYLINIPKRYWIVINGRALKTFRRVYPKIPVEKILNDNKESCSELADTKHFHIDLFGNYIPGLCTGLSLDYNDLGTNISKHKYPIISILYTNGINALYRFAVNEYGFKPEDSYISKCDLCYDIRKKLVLDLSYVSNDLNPIDFYKHE